MNRNLLKRKSAAQGKQVSSIAVLAVIIIGCLLAGVISGQDPYYMHTDQISQAPSDRKSVV